MPRSTLPTCAASASLPAAETMTGGVHFRHPGRRWQLCETPYFATRGRGDMRGVPNRSPSIAPRRWCGAVLPPWFYVYHLVYHMVVWCNDGLPPPPGWHIWDAVWWSPHVADTPVGEIRGYAQRQPPTGVGNYIALGLLSATGGVAATASYAGWCFSSMTYCKKVCPAPGGAGHRDTSSVKRLLHYY